MAPATTSPSASVPFPTWRAALSRREAAPPITTSSAFLLLVLYTVLYVAPLYISPLSRPSRKVTRDNPAVIRARIRSVSVSCAVCTGITLLVLICGSGRVSAWDAAHALGYWPVGFQEAANCLVLTATLFVGPLFRYFVAGDGIQEWMALEPVKDVRNDMTVWRNIVAGPVTEEILFRSSAVPLLLLSPLSPGKSIFLSPLVFGLAHMNHFYERRLQRSHVPIQTDVLITAFQLTYTTLFGAFATFVFIRTGSVLAATVVHAFCNSMGFPMVGRPVDGPGGQRMERIWTILYHALLVLGAIAFGTGLRWWTGSENALIGGI